MKKSRKTAVLVMLAVFYGFSQVLGLGMLQAVTTVQEAASEDSDFYANAPNYDAGYDDNLTIGGPADIWTAVAFTNDAPASAAVSDFSITFDIQEDLPNNATFTLNIWALGGPWNENSTRNDISAYQHIALGSVQGKVGLLPNGDNSITLYGSNLTLQYTDGQLANGIFWQDNDLAMKFPDGATAFSKDTPGGLGEIGYTTYTSVVPEPSTWAMLGATSVALLLLRRRHLA